MSKKILFIPSWYPSHQNEITGSFFREQAQLLVAAGYDVRILAGITETARSPMDLYSRVKRKLPCLSFLLPERTVDNEAPAVDLRTTDLLQDPVAYSFRLAMPEDIQEERWFALLCSTYGQAFEAIIAGGWTPDLIHAQCTYSGGIFAAYLGQRYSVPYYITEHQLFLIHTLSPFRQQLILDSLKCARRVVAVSAHQMKCILMHQPDCNVEVIWNLVNERLLQSSAAPRKVIFTIVTVTYPNPIKDHLTFLKAMQLLKTDKVEFRFIMIGNDSFHDLAAGNSDVFIADSRELGIEKYGEFIPFVKREDMAAILSNCDVFVCSSIAETFGVAAREAMLCGLPVVTTACGGVEDSITVQTGIVVPLKDPAAMASAILRIKSDPESYQPTVIREYIIRQCGSEAFIKRMEALYRS